MPKTKISDSQGLVTLTGNGTQITNHCNITDGTLNYKTKVITLPDAAKTLAPGDSGSKILMAAATGARVVTLPTAEAGLNFEVYVVDTGQNIDFEGSSAGMIGIMVDNNGVLTNSTTTNSIFRVADNASAADSFTLTCDGTNWHVRGVTADTTKFTFEA